MANLTEAATYDADIVQLETNTPALGGPGGVMNAQAQGLANRTKYLKAQVEGKVAKIGDKMTGALEIEAANPTVTLDRTSGAAGMTQVQFQSAGVMRWGINVTGAESTGNAGAVFYLQGFDDAGALAKHYLQIRRDTWQMSVNGAAVGTAQFSVQTDGAATVESAFHTNNASPGAAAETLWEASVFNVLRAGFSGRRAGAHGDAIIKSAASGVLREHLVLKGDGSATLGVGANAVTVTAAGQVQTPAAAPVAVNDLTRKDYVDGKMFPAGTTILFVQTAAPTGWTKSTAHNNKALRVVSGTVGSGGSLGFTAAFASRGLSGAVQSHTLTLGQMPLHTHGNGSSGTNVAYANLGTLFVYPTNAGSGNFIGYGSIPATQGAGNSEGHAHGLTMNNLDMAVAYVDAIIAVKD